MQVPGKSTWTLLACAVCCHAGAGPLTEVEAPPAVVLAPLVPELIVAPADPPGFDAAPAPAARLARLRGGADMVSNDMQLNGAVSGNAAVNVVTGANAISSGSFSNASGLPVAIQNSGANVLIQNATIINIQMQ
ncbi:hypothetical protein GJ698_07785 [Pseudoduganella sp. FT26W]|uniref:Uncharacterized protein n=1 Tax=Duganella aquatilis TaxID=2666082 RepID=A0A844CTA1_9BURK|nr:hypothetical protein [Duganella aquatilis]MRW83997.1 hypothetical protein [Duganella aquatilis]